jgi:cell division protein FtsI/penicillin-binding protein 2
MRARAALARTAPDRAKIAFWLFAAIGLFLTWRLFDIQVLHGAALSREALDQRAQTIDIFARRGTIYDRAGGVLVRSLKSESVYADPEQISDKKEIAEKLAPILGYKPQEIEAALDEHTEFRWLKRKIPHDVADRVRALNLAGVNIVQEETGRRFWTSGRLASTVLGFVGLDENGLSGLEYYYDDVLRGTSGKMMLEADPFQRAIPFGRQHIIEPPHPGDSLVLTLDGYLQFEAERLLDAQVRAFHARSGSVIVMDPRTGGILAMANVPDFDPAHYAASKPRAWRDRAITDSYEPGSTFKLITAAAALESGKVTPASRFPARDQIDVDGSVIHNAEDDMPLPGDTETLGQIIEYSHNVGAAEVAMRIGAQTEYRMIRRFGFGDPTGVDLPGESGGIVPRLDDWSGTSLPTIAFGQGISVTPLALARAYCAIANGGILLRPRIVRAVLDAHGNVVRRIGPQIERRVISPRIAAILRDYLRAVVVHGTGNPTARVPGYTTAGKTGTAQVVQNGRYQPGDYIASFIGFVPAERPRFVILVKIDRPRGAYYGSIVAAPVFAKLARIAMLHAGIFPQVPARLVTAKDGAKK